jgi:hypothetical protein
VAQRAARGGLAPPNQLPPAAVGPADRTPVFEAARADWFETPAPQAQAPWDQQPAGSAPPWQMEDQDGDGDGHGPAPSSPGEVRSMLGRYRTTWTHGGNQ